MIRIHYRCIDVLRLILGLVFIASSLLKVFSISTFQIEVGEYIDLYMPWWMHGWDIAYAVGVCLVELVVGLMAFSRKYARCMSVLSVLLLSFFVWLTGVNLFFPTIFGSVESCGCFGELVHFTPLTSFIKSVVLWIFALLLLLQTYRFYPTT